MYVITGATGNTGKEIAYSLLAAGKPVTVIGRNAETLQAFKNKGAHIAVGDLEDSAFLARTFEGATAVYAMIPPKWDLQIDWRAYQRAISTALTDAIRQARVQHVVVLSSQGAHLPEGAGPVSGLHEFEEMLKTIPTLNVMNLRAGFFMQNFFPMLGMIKHMNIVGYSLQQDIKISFVHTRDIAEVATRHLLTLDFKGHQFTFVAGAADLTMEEATAVLAQGLGKSDLKYVVFTPDEGRAGMIQNGIPPTIADGYTQLFECLNSGAYLNNFVRDASNTTPTTLAQFVAEEFLPAYSAF
jgi:uncharacterized protein YbjT (DUF2867 family)